MCFLIDNRARPCIPISTRCPAIDTLWRNSPSLMTIVNCFDFLIFAVTFATLTPAESILKDRP